ncbi:GPO family capsid scaffolding protein [Enterobacter cloacae]|uniref:GPO family capsid scaffolding protein n=1 Tax=Enterobacter cloacae TaxID=550 RepID=UPI002B1E69B0|nr:GPO family capsid scaffolding protein [Enterobacter cloacae]MEA3725884.1 GPO family capsid scaffolding protein [Enterobacter cloacae]MEA3730837.1 GPO family capsid scaffolding protein [Enterobacter cloacae]MEA3740123.1 GPO family capsid scaffolding protein [Enterobacter cloacae]MEA3754014.1 GPO family capsid scaffolding protein [Enterobacter cloacae]MEA3768090.1 GPO family capsid scaffolding protein [Enterobacter cloacae]
MSQSHLKTDWLCIATEGDTVDGRYLKKQWLVDAAETYNPQHYGALIWPEHQAGINYGEVLAVKGEEGEDGLYRLYAQIRPNAYLLEANRYDQLIYFSVELTPDGNFRGTGRTYLEGLAVTDTPASVGTTRLRFSRRKKRNADNYGCVITREGKITQETVMKKEWQSYFGIKPKAKNFAEGDGGEQPSGDDQLNVLANAVNELEGRMDAVESQLQTLSADMDTVAEVMDTEDFARLRDNLGNILANFGKLDKKVTQLPKRNFGQQEKTGRFKVL